MNQKDDKMVQAIAVDWNKAPLSLEKISELMLDWRLYPREQVDQDVVANYARALQAGSQFPPIKIGVLRGKKIVADGFHRIRAREKIHMDYIECLSIKFESEAQLFAEAVKTNSGHGKNFTNEEIDRNIRRLKKYNFNPQSIQSIVHVPAAEIIQEFKLPITHVVGPNGKRRPCTSIDPQEPGIEGLICLKSSLMVVCRWVEANKIPNDPPFPELTERIRTALKHVCFNNNRVS